MVRFTPPPHMGDFCSCVVFVCVYMLPLAKYPCSQLLLCIRSPCSLSPCPVRAARAPPFIQAIRCLPRLARILLGFAMSSHAGEQQIAPTGAVPVSGSSGAAAVAGAVAVAPSVVIGSLEEEVAAADAGNVNGRATSETDVVPKDGAAMGAAVLASSVPVAVAVGPAEGAAVETAAVAGENGSKRAGAVENVKAMLRDLSVHQTVPPVEAKTEISVPTSKASMPTTGTETESTVDQNEGEAVAVAANQTDRRQRPEGGRLGSGISGGVGSGGLGEAGQKARKSILGALMPAAACLVDDPAAEVRGTAAVALGEMLRLMVGFEDYVAALGSARFGGLGGGGAVESGADGGIRAGAVTKRVSGLENDSMATCCCVTGEDEYGGGDMAACGASRKRGEADDRTAVEGVESGSGRRGGRVCHGKVLQAAMAAAAAAAAAAEAAEEAAMAAELMDLAGFDSAEDQLDVDENEQSASGGEGSDNPQLPFGKHDDAGGNDVGLVGPAEQGGESYELAENVTAVTGEVDGEDTHVTLAHQKNALFNSCEIRRGVVSENESDSGRGSIGDCGEADGDEHTETGFDDANENSGGGSGGNLSVEADDGGQAVVEPSSSVDAELGANAKTPARRPLSASARPYLPQQLTAARDGADKKEQTPTEENVEVSPPSILPELVLQMEAIEGGNGNLEMEQGLGEQQYEGDAQRQHRRSGQEHEMIDPSASSADKSDEMADGEGGGGGRSSIGSSDGEGYETGTSSVGGASSVDAIDGEQKNPDDSENLNNLDPAEFVDIYNPSSDLLIVLVARLLLDTNAHVACTMLQALRPAWMPELGPGPSPEGSAGSDGVGASCAAAGAAATAVAGEAM